MTEENYRPRSPDFSSPTHPDYRSSTAISNSYLPCNPTSYAPQSPINTSQRSSYDYPTFFPSSSSPTSFSRPTSSRVCQQYIPPASNIEEMARRSSRLQAADASFAAVPQPQPVQSMPPMPPMEPIQPIQPMQQMMPVTEPSPPPPPEEHTFDARPGAGIEVKTKFPVARIKRIMQADEDVGKVAQVTPIAVFQLHTQRIIRCESEENPIAGSLFLTSNSLTAKALELFMISLVTKAAQEAKERNSKRVTATHLKHAVAKDDVLDFLADIIAKVPDAPASRKHEDDGSDQNEGRRKRGGRRPKEESD
ncbi:DNA polymerase epsilon subunit C [Penicillium diatomitis]|uniref:DNA polymerase epsilon subunit C n=1 Tax=Penicillium diatomitis TaxID=2819901 RepID=A0A9W9XEH2_9EURO|nr:DNA polymerase epsilon subunit C [Penicillium diatomitis]KAJ5489751.1 DNA polymerase epsilon subunit C [Penicillium diatomitis]